MSVAHKGNAFEGPAQGAWLKEETLALRPRLANKNVYKI